MIPVQLSQYDHCRGVGALVLLVLYGGAAEMEACFMIFFGGKM